MIHFIFRTFKVFFSQPYYAFSNLLIIVISIGTIMSVSSLANQYLSNYQNPNNKNSYIVIKDLNWQIPKVDDRSINSSNIPPSKDMLGYLSEHMMGYKKFSIFSNLSSINIDDHEFEIRFVDSNYFSVNDIEFIEGRDFNQYEYLVRDKLVILSRETSLLLFDNTKSNQVLILNNQRHRVLGIVEDVPSLNQTGHAEIWVLDTPPKKLETDDMARSHDLHYGYQAIITGSQPKNQLLRQVNAHLDNLSKQYFQSIIKFTAKPAQGWSEITQYVFSEFHFNSVFTFNIGLFISYLLIIALPCINTINLNNSRIIERRVEIGLKRAFGYSQFEIVSLLLIENGILTLFGSALSFITASFFIELLNIYSPLHNISLVVNNLWMFTSVFIIFVVSIITGLGPALKLARLEPAQVLASY